MDTKTQEDKKSDLQTLKEAGSALKGKYEDFVKNKPTVKKVNSGLFVVLKWCFLVLVVLFVILLIVDYKDSQGSVKVPKIKLETRTVNLNELAGQGLNLDELVGEAK